jgi:hypothetical protein
MIFKGWFVRFIRNFSAGVLRNLRFTLAALCNKRYRLQNIYNIKSKEKLTISFKLNPLQIEIEQKIEQMKKAQKPLRLIILKPRQIGCTTYFCVRNFDQCYTTKNQFCAVIAHLREKAHEIFNEIVKFTYDSLPKNLRFPAYNDAIHHLAWRTISSQIKVTSEGHGITPNILHLTEVAHMRNPKNMILEALQGVPLNSGLVVMESTANGRGGYFYDTWHDSESDPESIWQTIFLKWWKHPDYALPVPENFKITPEEQEILDAFKDDGFRIENLIFRRIKIAEAGKDKIDAETGLSGLLSFHQNYPLTPQQAFIVPLNCLFNVDALNWMDLHKIQPIEKQKLGRGWLRTYFEKQPKISYLIAADTAFGASKDYSVAIVLEKKSKRMVAVLRGKYGSIEFSKYLLSLGKFYNTALIAVERNMGQAVLNELINHSEYSNIYYHEEFDEFRRRTLRPGFYTSSQSRNLILGALEEAIRTKTLIIHDETVLSELLAFGLVGGRYEAVSGNDDCVMALAIGNYICNEIREMPDFGTFGGIEKPVGI